MPTALSDAAVLAAIADAQTAAREQRTKAITVDGKSRTIHRPFPSPTEWRDCCIYFLMLDRFNNSSAAPKETWNRVCDVRQGGTFKGVQSRLGYLQTLGVNAIWISPVLKNSRPDNWEYNYHGYGAQDFLNLDARFASDGTLATAEKELTDLVDEAHARGIYVILDIVLNHAARVFDYVRGGSVVDSFADASVINGPLGSEPDVQWLNGLGFPRADWQNQLPDPSKLSADDAVWPTDLQNDLFFRRRGSKLSDTPDSRGFVPGDFGTMRQLVVEYDATGPGQEALRDKYGVSPVLNILIRSYAYLMARYDFDGYRIDTVKYVSEKMIETFGNAMREYALSIGKANFFTFGEIYDNEEVIDEFIGRHSGATGESFGIDAALDFPVFYKLPGIAKGMTDVADLRKVFTLRKQREEGLLSSHGEAGRYFVTFVDNHDQHERIKHPFTPEEQVTLGMTLLLSLQGIPCIYYGTEQLLQGTVDASGNPDLNSNESVREALWGKPNAFSTTTSMYQSIQRLLQLRQNEPALRYGRQYFREVSGNGTDFGQSFGAGGIVAFSRVLGDREVVIAANTGATEFTGKILVDRDLNATAQNMIQMFASKAGEGTGSVQMIDAKIQQAGLVTTARIAAVDVQLAPREVQIWTTPVAAAVKPLRARAAG
jgi:glycosidase